MQILFFLAGGLVQFPLQQLWKFPCRDPCPATPILQFTSSRIRACPNSVTTVVAIRPFRILDTVNSTFEQTWTFTFSEKRTRPMSPTRIWKFALSEFRPSKQSRTFSFFDNQTGSSPPRTDLKIQFLWDRDMSHFPHTDSDIQLFWFRACPISTSTDLQIHFFWDWIMSQFTLAHFEFLLLEFWTGCTFTFSVNGCIELGPPEGHF